MDTDDLAAVDSYLSAMEKSVLDVWDDVSTDVSTEALQSVLDNLENVREWVSGQVEQMSTGHVPPVSIPAPTDTSTGQPHDETPTKRGATWDRDRARALLAQGQTYEQVADAVGTSAKTIQRLKAADRKAAEG